MKVPNQINLKSALYNQKIKDVKIRLTGDMADSGFYCELKHPGLSYFTDEGKVVS